jgi:hypothetical protein
MKKSKKRLSLGRETLNNLQLNQVTGGGFTSGCPTSRIQCPSNQESSCPACTWE